MQFVTASMFTQRGRMYANVSTLQIKPGDITAFTQIWDNQFEFAINQLSRLVDLYLLVNPETHTVLLMAIYLSEADALACQTSCEYQQFVAQLASLPLTETIVHTGYAVIST
jgi:hypothetical protein